MHSKRCKCVSKYCSQRRIADVRLVAEEDAPSGMLARGHYTAVSTFIDDDKHKHLEFEWSFDISKDW